MNIHGSMSGFWWEVAADHLTTLQNGMDSSWLISDVGKVVWLWRLQLGECMLQISISFQEIISRVSDFTLFSILKPNHALPTGRQLLYNKADDWIVRMIAGCYLRINSSNPIVLNLGQERPVSKGFVDRQIDKQYFKSSNFQKSRKSTNKTGREFQQFK